jgi:hypothetical protein
MTLVILASNVGFLAPLGMTRVERWTLSARRFSSILIKHVDVTFVDLRRAPGSDIGLR